MKNAEELKQIVKEKYGEIAEKADSKKSCGCGCSTASEDFTVFADDYSMLEGYLKEADLSLGCGIPTEHARIRKGDTVVDLGAGAGNDCFVARAITGDTGRVIGLDFTEKMIKKARENAEKLGYTNVEFVLGEIENMPIEDNTADVVVSNCVLNLVPNKEKAFRETYRIIRPGGHFSISDIVLKGDLPEGLRYDAAMYAGCVSGAIDISDYLTIIRNAGFKNVNIQREQKNVLPEEIYLKYFTRDEWENYKNSGAGIFSITVYGEK
ncbi:MAG: arsenite methyltransferase [Cyclobacteriaceae bacterium]|nr:arsenite methyltransferase [Cyclobacteriaceae bacterium]